MTKFKKIKEIIEAYRKTADRHYASYQAQEKAAREKYSEPGFQSEFVRKVWPEMAGKIWAECDDTIRKVEEVFSEIEQDFKKWVMEPLDGSTVQILDCVERFGLSLSLNELQVLESSVRSSYLGTKIFAGLAEKNGYSVNAPSMKEFENALKLARGNASFALKAYAGTPGDKFPGKDLLEKWTYQGITYGDYTTHHMFMSYNYLHEGGEIDRLEAMFGEIHAPMKYILTKDESEKVEKSVKDIMHNGEINKKAAQELIKKQPDFKDRLESMPDEFFEGKEALTIYFRLNEKAEKEESLIIPGSRQAAEYGANRFQRVDAESLKQFE